MISLVLFFVAYARAGSASLAKVPFSFTIHNVANAKEDELMPSAPLTPKYLTNMKTLTTRTFKGIPNRFIMTDRCESGMYLLRKVPIDGKYIPTQASNAKKEAINAGSDAELTVYVAVDMAMVAIANIPVVTPSVVGPFIFANCPKRVDPNRQDAMKQEKTVP